ncbi:MAG: queuosine precursor transporter [Planctomycetes bacterium]|nr:queuosine precursor transporter [Planctomycetota bacterium]
MKTTTVDHLAPAPRYYKYYDLVMVAFVVVLLCSNLIGPGKSCAIDLGAKIVPAWNADKGLFFTSLLIFGAGNIFFPISYIFGDILTEVYGYARTRKVIWAGFGAMIFAAIMARVVIALPANPHEPWNEKFVPAVALVFGSTWRIVVASMFAFWAGDFANSYVMAKMKILTKGRHLWTRTIGSTAIGQLVDSAIFYPVAFWGTWTPDTMLAIIAFNWGFKVSVEVIFTPLTYAIVGFLKRAENEDYYDVNTNFTPFSLKE